MGRANLDRCESTYVHAFSDGTTHLEDGRSHPLLGVYACYQAPGHTGLHRQAKAGGHQDTTWTDEEAVRNRCPSLTPEPVYSTDEWKPEHLRCAREAGHTGVHSMIVLRPYGRADQIDWP